MLIAWDEILKYITPTGIIHVGAYTAEERHVYGDIPTKWVEADGELVRNMMDKGIKNIHHFAATSYNGFASFNVCEFKPASSLLTPHLNAQRRKDVRVVKTINVPARKIETIQEEGYNFIAMDIQGGELLALMGVDFSIGPIDGLLLEVHELETYKNCPQISEIDSYLSERGYQRVITKMTRKGWGDALYTKK